MKKLLSTTIAAGIFATINLAPLAYADVAATALPSLHDATNADVTIKNADMNIQIQGGQGGVGTLNWNSFNVGKDASVNYEFTAHNQTALNKVNAAGGLSQIYGRITDSGCSGCGYAGTGKIILINPNGVLFGDGANVNVNSFTVSTMPGTFDQAANQLKLERDGSSAYGILVQEGANIYGDKAVNLISDDVKVYTGSQISTNVAPNYNGGADSFGKVKIVTADGVNFAYYNNGAVKNMSGFKTATDKMTIQLNGDIKSGNIDVRNYSSNDGSEINLDGATLKATKAVSGNDGNIWLTASNKVVMENSKLETANYSADAAARNGGNIEILAGNKVSIGTTDIDAVGNVKLTSQNFDVVVDNTTIDTPEDLDITAGRIASIQNGSKVNADNVTVNGTTRGQVTKNSAVNAANNIDVAGNDAWINTSKLTAGNEINVTGKTGYVIAEGASADAKKITLDAKTNATGDIDVNGKQANIYAGNDIDVTLANVGNRANGLVAEAGNNLKVSTDGTLSVSRLVAKKGDLTINADKVIAGLPYTAEQKLADDLVNPRSYIEVRNGKFTSNTKHDSYDVTASGERTADNQWNMRHHIQYGNGAEKILLVTKMPYVEPVDPVDPIIIDPTPVPQIDDDQAAMLNKLPRQPESMNNVNNVNDGRTTFVDVFAAASQIELDDEEEQ